MKKRILLQYHILSREYVIIENIRKELEKLGHIVGFADFMDVEACLEFEPDIIITHPIRTDTDVKCLSLMKVATNAMIIPMVVEGYYNWDNYSEVLMYVGMAKCSDKLIDYYFEWGKKTALAEGECLRNLGKITSLDKVKVFGYIPYEKDKMFNYYGDQKTLREYTEWKSAYDDIFLCLTGFHDADLSIENIYIEQNFTAEEGTEEYLKEVNFYEKYFSYIKKYREKYFNVIAAIAEKYPDKGIVVKLHPVEIQRFKEREKFYEEKISCYPNVYILKEAFPNSVVLKDSKLMIHYGSTSVLEAYIHEVPSVLLTDETGDIIRPVAGDMRFFSGTWYMDINNPDYIVNNIESVGFIKDDKVESILKEGFSWEKNKNYSPSKDIALFLDGKLEGSKLDLSEQIDKNYIPVSYLNYKKKTILFIILKQIIKLEFDKVKKYCKFYRRLSL